MLVDCFLSLWFCGLINLGEYSKGKATRNHALAVYKSGALRSVNTGHARTGLISKLQVDSNSVFTFISDSANTPARFRRCLLHTESEWGDLGCLGIVTMRRFFWFWNHLRSIVDHSVWPQKGAATPVWAFSGFVSCRTLSPSCGRPPWSPQP